MQVLKDFLVKSIVRASKSKKVLCIAIAVTALVSLGTNSRRMKAIARDYLPRNLSVYLGDGLCLWRPPIYDVPTNITFQKTIVAGYPSGDKRLTFVQMEALTGLSARDEWDFEFLVSCLSAMNFNSCGFIFCDHYVVYSQWTFEPFDY